MTVCIGAICESGKSVVVAADRMVTFGSPMNLQAEPPTLRKIFSVGESCVLLFSGSVPDGEEIVAEVQSRLTQKNLQVAKVAKVADATKSAYITLKRKRVEETILGPMFGVGYKDFQNLVVQSSASQILMQTVGMVSQHNLQLDFLIAGTDATGAHLHLASHPGQLQSVNMVGYAAIGSGGLHAMVQLSLAQHTAAAALSEAVFNVHEAKKAAEVAPGVGKFTDLAIIRGGKVYELKADALSTLEQVHKEKPALSQEEWSRIQKVCDESTANRN